jgi:hypothetical protein
VVNASRAVTLATALILTCCTIWVISGCSSIATNSALPTPKAPAAALTISTSALPNAVVGLGYQIQVTAHGGTPPYSWRVGSSTLPQGIPRSVTTATSSDAQVTTAYTATVGARGRVPPYSRIPGSGRLPDGLTLSSAGTISGTPEQSGLYSFSVQVQDAAAETESKPLTLNVAAPKVLTISTPGLPSTSVGSVYAATLQANGSVPPYSWSLSAGGLPAGLSLSSRGVISGAPTQAGLFNFMVSATDFAGESGNKTFTLAVAAARGTLCGVGADGTTIHLPAHYGTLPMPGVGRTNSIVDSPLGCEIWKLFDMAVVDSLIEVIDSNDRWAVVKPATTGEPSYWFNKVGSTKIVDLYTGAVVCSPNIPGAGGWLWGSADRVRADGFNDRDTLFYHVTNTNQIWRLNIPACIAAGGVANAPGPAVSLWDTLTGLSGSNLVWGADGADISADGDLLTVNWNDGGVAKDPRVYQISTKRLGPALKLNTSPYYPPGCTANPSKGNCYRGAYVAPLGTGTSARILVPYNPLASDPDPKRNPLEVYDAWTGNLLRTLTEHTGHGNIASYGSNEYHIMVTNALDVATPPNCVPGLQSIRVSDGSRACLLHNSKYQNVYVNARSTDMGNPYAAFFLMDAIATTPPLITTYAGLPRPASGNSMITDAAVAGDCSAGGGSQIAFCTTNSGNWSTYWTAGYPPRFDWSSAWTQFENEIVLVYLDGSVPRHVVHPRSLTVEPYYAYKAGDTRVIAYWSQVHPVISRSGKYIIYSSTWGGNNNVSVYVARIK